MELDYDLVVCVVCSALVFFFLNKRDANDEYSDEELEPEKQKKN